MRLVVSSLVNPLVKQATELMQKKYRDQSGCFLLEGLKNVEQALSSSWQIERVFAFVSAMKEDELARLLAGTAEKSIPVVEVNQAVLEKITDVKTPQPVVAVVRKKLYQLDDVSLDDNSFLLVLDEVSDPGNLGTIVRTAVAAGISALVLTTNCADIFSPKTVRSTMGGLFHLPIISGFEKKALIECLKTKGFKLAISTGVGGQSLYQADFAGRCALVMGNESKGVDQLFCQAADMQVTIPMREQSESLNVAVAAALIMYQARGATVFQ